ncbi:MAG: hypothetical protein CMP10_04155 [Zetaproteobacteria bacterium]|nr:hypothetical protein [Pseudobdellovibrionaceae bacterium]
MATKIIFNLLILLESICFGQSFNPNDGFEADIDLKPTDVIFWNAVEANHPKGSKTIKVGIRLRTEQEFTLYASKLKFTGPAGYELVKGFYPPTRSIIDPVGGEKVNVYYGGDFELEFQGLDAWTSDIFPVAINFLGCTTRICLFPYTQTIEIPVYRTEVITEVQEATSSPQQENNVAPNTTDHSEQSWATKLTKGELPLGLMLIVVFIAGIATNLTPCVFPMIPITLRVLGGQTKRTAMPSILYALGIVLTYSGIGIFVSMTGGVFGAMLASVTFNITFAIIFIILALTMIGFGNFSSLQTLGNKLGSGKQSHFNTFLMGTGAGLVAAPCTGPILGALLVYSASHPEQSSTYLFFLYSFGFALPYVFLGMSASKISNLKVSPKLQVTVKIIFAALMFALAFYYLRVPFYDLTKQLANLWKPLAIGLTPVGTLLLALILKRNNLIHNKQILSTSAIILGFGLFACTQWFTSHAPSEIVYREYHNEQEALLAGNESGKPILIDNWAEWCEACKKMDATTFLDPQVRQELQDHWIVAKLDLTEMNDRDQEITSKYGVPGLPTLVLLPSDANTDKMQKVVGYSSANELLEKLLKFREP